MNYMQDNVAHLGKNFPTNKPMVVKPTIIRNALMPPPSSAVRQFITPSSSRSRQKDGCQSSTSKTKSSSTVHSDSHVIVSVCEGRGKSSGIVGIAAIDIHRPVLILSQISDTQTYTATLTKLNILRPVEVLIPATFIDGAVPSRLITVIMTQFPNLSVTSLPRSEFNRSRGLQLIQNICAVAFNSVVLQINNKFYSSAAVCALLRYVEQTRRVSYSSKTIKIVYQEPENTTGIDIDTANLLQLVATTGKQKVSLFTVLDYCSTIPGKKLLRTNILQPPCSKNIIETRLDCVEELVENSSLLTRLQEVLKPLSQIESSLTYGTVVPATASIVSERQLTYTLQLKGLLLAVQPLADELKATKHPLFREIYNRFEGMDTRKNILKLINEIINEDAHLGKGQAGELQRCFAIKSGINGFLDLSRRLYTEGVDSMRSYVDDLATNSNLPLRVQHSIKNGFHIALPLTKAFRNLKQNDLPPVFTKYERFSSHLYLSTMDMINFDKRLKNNSTEIQNISNVIIYKLLVDIRPHISDLYQLCDDVAHLDMLVSLARASSVPNWVRPRLQDTHLNLEGLRHPVLEHVADKDLVAHSICAYPRANLHIITGPNMSGKTILLHSICHAQVLTQLGCYVPCTRASVRLSDRIYARMAHDEATIAASSFTLEMTKISYLLTTMTEKSFVVVDELCRTTASDEGVAMAVAICERIMKEGCFTFIATHFVSLTVMADMYPRVTNWHLETLEELRANNTRISLKFTYKLVPGVTSIDSYGIKLSRIFNSSKSISDRAAELYNYLLPLRKSLAAKSSSQEPEFLKFKLQAELDLLKIKNQLTDEIQKDKIAEFTNKTGLSFELSPLTIERGSSVLLDQSSNKKSSSTSKKLSSHSWVPTPSEESNETSNHKFSVPTSMKSSSVQNREDNEQNHIFSADPVDIQYQNFEANNCENITFDVTADISSIHQNNSTSEDIPVSTHVNKDFWFCHSEKQNIPNSFFEDINFKSIPSCSNKNILFPNLKNENIQSPTNVSFNKIKSFSQESNLQPPNSLPVASQPNKNLLLYNSEHENIASPSQNIIYIKPKNIMQSLLSQETNWSEAGNSLKVNEKFANNLIVNSTPSTTKCTTPKLVEIQNKNSSVMLPIPKAQIAQENIPPQIRLVSNLYDTLSDSENSQENEENDSDECVIISDNETREINFSEMSSPDEINFTEYLKLRSGVTSTPITKDVYNNPSESTDEEIIEIDSSKIFSIHTVLSDETFNNSEFCESILKRKITPVETKNIVGNKQKKIVQSPPAIDSPNMFSSCSSFKSCISSSELSKYSTSVMIGQNVKKRPFLVATTPTTINDTIFEQDTVVRSNKTKYFSPNFDDSK